MGLSIMTEHSFSLLHNIRRDADVNPLRSATVSKMDPLRFYQNRLAATRQMATDKLAFAKV